MPAGLPLFIFMKKILFLIILSLSLLFSCAAREELKPAVPVVHLPPEKPVTVVPEIKPPAVPLPRYQEQIRCEDDTLKTYNLCGLDILPFFRTLFFDMDNDGSDEMIVGSRDGSLRLYRNTGSREAPRWSLEPHYFDGIRAGAFSAPAVGDLDRDAIPEVMIGAGGFSDDSGRVVLYKNAGTLREPLWTVAEGVSIHAGKDATPVLFDIDADGRLDLIVGNADGKLTFFRNRSAGRTIAFEKETGFFEGIRLGMYVVPAVASVGGRIVIIAGDSMGKLSLLEGSRRGGANWSRSSLKIVMENFAAPTFIETGDSQRKDLVVADGNGRLFYYRNRKNYQQWEELPDYFSGRVLAGPACTPSLSEKEGERLLVTGNINGSIRLFEHDPGSVRLPWKERKDFFRGIKLSGFSKGVMTQWEGKVLLVTGQQDGFLRAFVRSEQQGPPAWTEKKGFFSGIEKIMHASPAVFDIDGDGRWEVIVGDADGQVRGFRYSLASPGELPSWEEMKGTFGKVRVGRFASPSLFREGMKLYLLAGQQDGTIAVFSAELAEGKAVVFERADLLQGIRVDTHSSPSVLSKDGLIELSVGDYSGSLRHFACRRVDVEIQGNQPY
ncbi:MAG: FG-GAP-like repeat-containing protein [Thermodesulfovibrionales bacterium]